MVGCPRRTGWLVPPFPQTIVPSHHENDDKHFRNLRVLPRQRGRLVVDGEIVAAAQEERFTREKYDATFPQQAIDYCLGKPASRLTVSTTSRSTTSRSPSSIGFSRRTFRTPRRASRVSHGDAGLAEEEAVHAADDSARRSRRDSRATLVFLDHHESHAASAFFPSPFDDAAILTLDGVGEWSTAAYGTGAGNKIDADARLQFPHSLGLLYSAFTYYCGFKVNSGEYKLMGLAPYGQPIYRDLILQAPDRPQAGRQSLAEHGVLQLLPGPDDDEPAVRRAVRRAAAEAGLELEQRHMDLAASIQAVTEEVVLRMGRELHRADRA